MDLLTQGVMGATLAQAGARSREAWTAAWIGFASGLLADADVLIQSSTDPLLQLEYHRHFTHSLFFVPIGALLAALILWPLLHRRLPFRRAYVYALLGFSMSGLLDACTSYGTYWLWPLVDAPLAFNIISIVDPVFTVSLLLGVALGYKRLSPVPARLGLVIAAGYLLIGLVQHERAAAVAMALAGERGHAVERQVVKPTIGNLLLWRSVYEADGRFHVDAVRVGLGGALVFQGESAPVLHPADLPLPASSVQAGDVQRFSRFSDGYVIRHPGCSDVLGDVRYSMLPTSIRPLWGIALNPEQADTHVEYQVLRTLSTAERQQFMAMLRGDRV